LAATARLKTCSVVESIAADRAIKADRDIRVATAITVQDLQWKCNGLPLEVIVGKASPQVKELWRLYGGFQRFYSWRLFSVALVDQQISTPF
jgi:hypothetical protein